MTGDPTRGRLVKGRVTRVEICPCGGIVLSVGPISLRLDAEAAADVASTLAFAIYGARPGETSDGVRGASALVSARASGEEEDPN